MLLVDGLQPHRRAGLCAMPSASTSAQQDGARGPVFDAQPPRPLQKPIHRVTTRAPGDRPRQSDLASLASARDRPSAPAGGTPRRRLRRGLEPMPGFRCRATMLSTCVARRSCRSFELRRSRNAGWPADALSSWSIDRMRPSRNAVVDGLPNRGRRAEHDGELFRPLEIVHALAPGSITCSVCTHTSPSGCHSFLLTTDQRTAGETVSR